MSQLVELIKVAEEMYSHLEKEYGHGIANGYWETVAAMMQRAFLAIDAAKKHVNNSAKLAAGDRRDWDECDRIEEGSGIIP